MKHILNIGLLWIISTAAFSQIQLTYPKQSLSMETLDRGLIAIRQSEDSISVSWRLLEEDPDSVLFDLYVGNRPLVKNTSLTHINLSTKSFNFTQPNKFRLKAHAKKSPVLKRLAFASYILPANAPLGYLDIALKKPADAQDDKNIRYSYSPNDCTAADVDGDGQLEIIVKWDPSNSHDNSHAGFTGNVYIDCYEINQQSGYENDNDNHNNFKWRIDLGPNIRAGAHYTQIIAYDLDGDGKAEVIMKTADGTIDGQGKCIGDPKAYYKDEKGMIPTGPEYLTVFSGETGEALYTTDYVPERGPLGYWGDLKSNRSERYLACVGYLGNANHNPNDNKITHRHINKSTQQPKLLPSVIMCRGYYTRATLVAWDWDGKKLSQRWFFDSYEGAEVVDKKDKWVVKTPGPWGDYSGQGNHSLRVADVDGDGFDEIIYGSCTIDHNGKGLYSTKLGHGDAMHLMPMLPDDRHLYVWQCHEEHGKGSTLRDAATGRILFQIPFEEDCGRCMAADIDPTNPGVEMWSLCTAGIRNYKGEVIATPRKISLNFGIWWDGDTLRELLDKTSISKFNWRTREVETIAKFAGVRSNNGTKATPALAGDLLGDWREELILPSMDGQHLRIFLTPYPTKYRFKTLLQDIPYRHSLTVQNVGYNQPAEMGSWLAR